MQHFNTVLAPIWQAAHQNQTDADRREHRRQVDALLHKSATVAKKIIPEHLHRAGPEQRRHVSGADIVRLKLGRALALATRALLPAGAGNQFLAVAATAGNCQLNNVGVRNIAPPGIALTEALARMAVIGEGGSCDEHFSVAFELARSLDLPAVTVANADDHGALVLYPELGDHAVVVDAWTTFPGSCLKRDSGFTQVVAQFEHHRPGAPAADQLNLVTTGTIRARLEEQLGKAALQRAQREDYLATNPEKFTGLTSPRQLNDRLSDLLLRVSANNIDSAPRRKITITNLLNDRGEGPFADTGSAACEEVARRATASTAPMLDALQETAHDAARRSPTRQAIQQRYWTTTMVIDRINIAKVDVEMTATARPVLRDERLASRNILYVGDDGSRMSTTVAPQHLIDVAARGWHRARRLNFPDGYR